MTVAAAPPATPAPDLLDEAERIAWLRLIRSENVGPRIFEQLRTHFKTIGEALEALPELARRGGARRAIRICSKAEAEAELAAAEAWGARFVALGEAEYPKHLASIDAPPPLLSMRGDGAIARRDAVAIVGARNCSLAGAKLAAILATGLGDHGYAIVSGLARGIDAAAHRASLESGTIAVFAGGLDRVYPPEHHDLVEAILENGGAVVGEMPFGHAARGKDFPRRNRIISGIAFGVVVVEAASRSGTLHTARFALEQNREIFAAPGSPLDPRSEGCNRLIREGAHLVTGTADITQVLAPIAGRMPLVQAPAFAEPVPAAAEPVEPGAADRDRVLAALGSAPVAVDELVRHTGLAPRAVQLILLELELAQRIERHGNQRISLAF